MRRFGYLKFVINWFSYSLFFFLFPSLIFIVLLTLFLYTRDIKNCPLLSGLCLSIYWLSISGTKDQRRTVYDGLERWHISSLLVYHICFAGKSCYRFLLFLVLRGFNILCILNIFSCQNTFLSNLIDVSGCPDSQELV